MSLDQPAWLVRGSTLNPMTFTFRLSNSGLSFATAPSSVVQTGVKSFGWEKRTTQLLPAHSWKWMGPAVESCVKSGAVSPSCTDIRLLLRVIDDKYSLSGTRFDSGSSGARAATRSWNAAHIEWLD